MLGGGGVGETGGWSVAIVSWGGQCKLICKKRSEVQVSGGALLIGAPCI